MNSVRVISSVFIIGQSDTRSREYLVGYKSYCLSKVLFPSFKDIYFLERTSLFVL